MGKLSRSAHRRAVNLFGTAPDPVGCFQVAIIVLFGAELNSKIEQQAALERHVRSAYRRH
jgi:hypothetical protein